MIVQEKLSNEQYKSAMKRIQLLDADGYTVQQRRKAAIESLQKSGI